MPLPNGTTRPECQNLTSNSVMSWDCSTYEGPNDISSKKWMNSTQYERGGYADFRNSFHYRSYLNSFKDTQHYLFEGWPWKGFRKYSSDRYQLEKKVAWYSQVIWEPILRNRRKMGHLYHWIRGNARI